MEWNEDHDVQPEETPEETQELVPAVEPEAVEPEPVEPEPVADEADPEPEQTSLLKKEISFRRKPKAP